MCPHRKAKQLAVCINTLKLVVAHLLICACTDASTTYFEPINLYATPLNAGQQRLQEESLRYVCDGDVLAPLERQIYWTIDRYNIKQSTSAGCTALHTLFQECVSMVTLICAHGPTVLTNPRPCKLVAECIFYACWAMTWTGLLIIFVVVKNIFHISNIIACLTLLYKLTL